MLKKICLFLLFCQFSNAQDFSQIKKWKRKIPVVISSNISEQNFTNLKNIRFRVIGIHKERHFEKSFKNLDKSIKFAPCHFLDGSPYEHSECSWDKDLVKKLPDLSQDYISYVNPRSNKPYGHLVLFLSFDESHLQDGQIKKDVLAIKLTEQMVFFNRVDNIKLVLKNININDNKINLDYDINISYEGHTEQDIEIVKKWYTYKKYKNLYKIRENQPKIYGQGYMIYNFNSINQK